MTLLSNPYNAEWNKGSKSQSAFRVNQDIGLYVKMAAEPKTKFKHYVFNFKKDNLAEIRKLKKLCPKNFVVLVCIKDKQICVIESDFLEKLITARIADVGAEEAQYNVQVHIKKGGSIRVYMSASGSKKTIVDDEKIVPRNAFPRLIFE